MSFKDNELFEFADRFFQLILPAFIRDLKICLTDNESGKHAYFPALITCISMLELMAGLLKGNVGGVKAKGIIEYAAKFMNKDIYSSTIIKLLYEAMRNKIAHLYHPFYVTKIRNPRLRLTWTVDEVAKAQAIELLPEGDKKLEKFTPPWEVPYDHRLWISLPTFQNDILASIVSYRALLKEDKSLQRNFEKCMLQFFPNA